MPAEPPVLVLVNPISGRGRSLVRARALAAALERRGLGATLRETRRDGPSLAGVTPERHRALVVVGGDGSLHAACNEPEALGLPLAFCGTGTVNVLARELRLPTAPDAVADLVVAGREARVPLLEANGRRFVLFAEAGWLGTVVARVNRWRRAAGRHGKLEFTRFGLGGLFSSWGAPLAARVRAADGAERAGRFSNAIATRARCYGGSLALPLCDAGRPALEAETFTFVGERMETPAGHALYLAAGGVGALARLGARRVERVLAREVAIEGPEEVGVHLDAESEHAALRLPLRVSAAGAALRLLVP